MCQVQRGMEKKKDFLSRYLNTFVKKGALDFDLHG